MAAGNVSLISVDDYLDAEELAETRHRCYDGLVTEMEGSSLEHAFLRSNFCSELHGALRGRGYGVVGANLMLRTGSKRLFLYPDAMVFRGPVETIEGRPNVVTNPVFVAEVLSPETEGFDRGAAAHKYRWTPSILQYALIAVNRPLVEIYTREADGDWWISEVIGLEADCAFSSLECSVPMAAIYEGVLES
jgi:Uma2 family endonuclease